MIRKDYIWKGKSNFLPPTPDKIGLPKKLGSFPMVSNIKNLNINFE